ncbi:hypothetical protein DBV15_04726 [Temnothorax longispinosus]|uniref:Uncharacterized protein n=1 Tax=Temnothorax longispinosus TaxID=300112 RepID=A0A4S2L6E4_9HYME|nr:hypothetical protein DBV15_04726 [Temnothorax longispinosus]
MEEKEEEYRGRPRDRRGSEEERWRQAMGQALLDERTLCFLTKGESGCGQRSAQWLLSRSGGKGRWIKGQTAAASLSDLGDCFI